MVYYYKKKLPTLDDIVIAKVEKISEYGIEVSLNEYDGIQGFINCGEVSRKKRVNLNKLLTVGKDILLNVIQVNPINKMIDLSKRTISDDDIKLFNAKHKTHIQLYNIFKYIYMKLNQIENPENIDELKLYDYMCLTLWEIQTEFENEYLIERLISKDTNNEILDLIDFETLNITNEKFKKILDEYIDTKINRIKPEINETIKLMTYSADGLKELKYTLDFKNYPFIKTLEKDFDIKILYISSSTYSLIIKQNEFDLTESNSIDEAVLMIKEEIKKRAIEKSIQNQII